MTLKAVMHYVSKHMRLSEPTTKVWMKIDQYDRRQRCSAMTVVYGNIRFMRIFTEATWRRLRRGVKRQWGNPKHRFQGFRTLRLRHLKKWGIHYYTSCNYPSSGKVNEKCHILGPASTETPTNMQSTCNKYVTLNDFKWLEGPFYLICSLLRTATD